jgi:hypothetical protein
MIIADILLTNYNNIPKIIDYFSVEISYRKKITDN